jgi:transposase
MGVNAPKCCLPHHAKESARFSSANSQRCLNPTLSRAITQNSAPIIAARPATARPKRRCYECERGIGNMHTICSGVMEGLNNKLKLTTRKPYRFRTFRAAEIALYHTLGALPEPEWSHRFC